MPMSEEVAELLPHLAKQEMNGNGWKSGGGNAGAYALFATRLKQNLMQPSLCDVGHKPE